MEFNIKEYKVQNKKKCNCGHEFSLKDINGLLRINVPGYYGNVVKHASKTICPNCRKETVLLLKQKGQTWEIIDIAVKENISKPQGIKNETKSKNEQEKITTNEFICPTCKKVCKSKIGLNAHMRTHNK